MRCQFRRRRVRCRLRGEVGPHIRREGRVDIQSRKVRDGERPEGGEARSETEPGHLIDDLGSGNTVAHEVQGLSEQGLLQAIGNESRHKPPEDRRALAGIAQEFGGAFGNPRVGAGMRHDLDKRDQECRTEVVRHDDPCRMGKVLGEIGRIKPGGIACQDHIRASDPVEVTEDFLLGRQILGDSLDDVGCPVRHLGKGVGGSQAREASGCNLGQKDAGLHQCIGNLTGPCDGGGGPARSGIPQGHADIVFESQGELGANTPTHEPGPDDGDAVDHSRWSTHGSECTAVADLVSGQGETGTHGMDGYRTRWRTRRRHVTMARC